jgi:hypothetical protein
MNSAKSKDGSIIHPLLQDLMQRQKADSDKTAPSVGSAPVEPADLYQDAGGGYNSDLTFPQN